MDKPVAESCLRNQDAILEAVRPYINMPERLVLEIGSGTGQHAVHISSELPNVVWQPSDLVDLLPGIRAWVDDYSLPNVRQPLALDVNDGESALAQQDLYHVVFTANTIHFVSMETASAVLRTAAIALKRDGILFVYGAFSEAGRYTSDGDRALDEWLKSRDPLSGLKDTAWLESKALSQSLECEARIKMPANNLLFVFRKRNSNV